MTETSEPQSLQDRYGPKSTCFGCGPANSKGLQIKSYPHGEETRATWQPQPHHEAFPGVLCGGIIGTLLDCHSNWTAAHSLMKKNRWTEIPCTVTAEYTVTMNRPTPTDGPVEISAVVEKSSERKAVVKATLTAGGKPCAMCRGTFVAVGEDHPAHGRWSASS